MLETNKVTFHQQLKQTSLDQHIPQLFQKFPHQEHSWQHLFKSKYEDLLISQLEITINLIVILNLNAMTFTIG